MRNITIYIMVALILFSHSFNAFSDTSNKACKADTFAEIKSLNDDLIGYANAFYNVSFDFDNKRAQYFEGEKEYTVKVEENKFLIYLNGKLVNDCSSIIETLFKEIVLLKDFSIDSVLSIILHFGYENSFQITNKEYEKNNALLGIALGVLQELIWGSELYANPVAYTIMGLVIVSMILYLYLFEKNLSSYDLAFSKHRTCYENAYKSDDFEDDLQECFRIHMEQVENKNITEDVFGFGIFSLYDCVKKDVVYSQEQGGSREKLFQCIINADELRIKAIETKEWLNYPHTIYQLF
ncbi:MAG: hypothetical protein ABIA04_09750 [Pseudomonadota bacterium]